MVLGLQRGHLDLEFPAQHLDQHSVQPGGIGKIWRFSNEAAIDMSLSGEWMLYRQFDPQEEQFTLKLELTLLLPKVEG